MTPILTRAAALWLLALTAAGCGDQPGTGQAGDATVPVTAEALAYVAAEHAGEPASAMASDDLDELGGTAVGVELRYGTDREYDGDALMVGVADHLPADEVPTDCDHARRLYLDGCEQTDRGLLTWQDEEPEEDPGYVSVLVEKDDGFALVYYAGPTITDGRDPREVDLPISVETLFDIANDPRVDLTTTAEADERGADAGYWG